MKLGKCIERQHHFTAPKKGRAKTLPLPTAIHRVTAKGWRFKGRVGKDYVFTAGGNQELSLTIGELREQCDTVAEPKQEARKHHAPVSRTHVPYDRKLEF